jgi:protein TonB
MSVAAHIAAALLVVLLPRVLPREAAPVEPGTVELLMVEQQGATPNQEGAGAESPSRPAEAPDKTVTKPPPPTAVVLPPPQETTEQAAPPQEKVEQVPPPQVKADQTAPPRETVTDAPPQQQAPDAPPPPAVPTPPLRAGTMPAEPKQDTEIRSAEPTRKQDTEIKSAEAATPRQESAPASATGPVFDLAGTESESNAYVLGAGVVPAQPDDRFRNRPPIFPHDAELRGEHGTVVVVIHVSESGVASSVDVMESSGVASLDRAATDAVRKWHFRPAMQEGRSVPFDMPFRFIFQAY